MTKVSDIYPSKWVTAADLGGRPRVLVIEAVSIEPVRQRDGSMQRKPVIRFRGATKRWIVNKTQAMALAEICGTDEIEQWVGHTVQLFPSTANNGQQTIDVRRPPSED
jgi:hypothetical protein